LQPAKKNNTTTNARILKIAFIIIEFYIIICLLD